MITTSEWNTSVIDNDYNIWVTPSAVDRVSLKVTDNMCKKKMEL